MKHTDDELVAAAADVREKAYAPYSNFKVGAAVETDEGNIYTGCNVESASYGLTVCAERVAIWKGISRGEKRFGVTQAERPWRARQVANDGLVGDRLGQGRGVLGPSWSQQ